MLVRLCVCDTFSTKTMWSACDLSPSAVVDSGRTVRYKSTKVHVGPLGPSSSEASLDAPAQLCAIEELVKLTEALVSKNERELTRRSSLRGDPTIDDVGSRSVAEHATENRTLQARCARRGCGRTGRRSIRIVRYRTFDVNSLFIIVALSRPRA